MWRPVEVLCLQLFGRPPAAGWAKGRAGVESVTWNRSAKKRASKHSHQPHHALFVNPQPQRVHYPPQAGALFLLLPRNCHSACGVLETRVPPISTVHCSGLWRFCARSASDARQWQARQKAQRGSNPSSGTEAPSNRHLSTVANPSHALFVNPQPQRIHHTPPSTVANPGHVLFMNPQPQHVHPEPQAEALSSLRLRKYHSASRVVKTHVQPIGTVHASDLWRVWARKVSDAAAGRNKGQGGSDPSPDTRHSLAHPMLRC